MGEEEGLMGVVVVVTVTEVVVVIGVYVVVGEREEECLDIVGDSDVGASKVVAAFGTPLPLLWINTGLLGVVCEFWVSLFANNDEMVGVLFDDKEPTSVPDGMDVAITVGILPLWFTGTTVVCVYEGDKNPCEGPFWRLLMSSVAPLCKTSTAAATSDESLLSKAGNSFKVHLVKEIQRVGMKIEWAWSSPAKHLRHDLEITLTACGRLRFNAITPTLMESWQD